MKKAIVFGTLIAVSIAAGALTLETTWIEGRVERRAGTAWVPLALGDKVETSDNVRLAPGALAEFSGGSRKIALSAPGVYLLDNLFKAVGDQSKKRAGALGMLGRMVDPKAAAAATVVGGIRGAEASGAGATVWMTDEGGPESLAEEAKAFARESRFADAATLFGEAAESAEGVERAGYLYSRAWAYAAGGAVIEALKALRGMSAETLGPWAGPRALLLARLDLDTGAASEARAILEAAIASNLLEAEDAALAAAMLQEAQAALE